ncbi:uncharacterized protein HD556DRAFT_1248132, partial [Suillus plorans]
MSNTQIDNTAELKIWQQNLNTSLVAQESLLNSPDILDWDILILQEPHINFLRNTRANHRWHVIYPTNHYTNPQQRTRAVTLIKASLDTNMWQQLSFPSSDVVLVQLNGTYGKCTIFNIYNDGTHHDTLRLIDQ